MQSKINYKKTNSIDENQHIIEQYFNHEVFSYTLLVSVLWLSSLMVFAVYRFFAEYFLDWDKIEGDAKSELYTVKSKARKMIFPTMLIQNNFMDILCWYWFFD
jgi:hypothetical protein